MNEFVEVKTQELIGAALDWAVAHATKAWTWAHEWYPTMTLDPTFRGVSDNAPGGQVRMVPNNPMRQDSQPFNPSIDWAQGGPLIHRHAIAPEPSDKYVEFGNQWQAHMVGKDSDLFFQTGDTPLIAACRVIVASSLGDTVSVPKELLQ